MLILSGSNYRIRNYNEWYLIIYASSNRGQSDLANQTKKASIF